MRGWLQYFSVANSGTIAGPADKTARTRILRLQVGSNCNLPSPLAGAKSRRFKLQFLSTTFAMSSRRTSCSLRLHRRQLVVVRCGVNGLLLEGTL